MPRSASLPSWREIQQSIVGCERCPRLRRHCAEIARVKRAAFRDEAYWGRPIPNLGSPSGRLLILGLAPAAHGANRTGRMFTGDRSGDFLFSAMHAEGFCNQATSERDDGLELIDCVITAAAHCAPPGNKPLPGELENCREHLERTVDAMPAVVGEGGGVVVLGKIAFDAGMGLYKRRGWMGEKMPRPRFGHGAFYRFAGAPFLLCTYHPSQQNTFTGKLTPGMLRAVFRRARAELDRGS